MFLRFISILSVVWITNGLPAEPIYNFHPLLPYQSEGRIVGGVATTIQQYPFQVSLQSYGHFCGGSIISKNYILTAAHCTSGQSASRLKVRVGSSYHAKGGELVSVKKIIRHEKYNPYIIDYDFSLLELTEPLNFTESIQAVPLPEQDSEVPTGGLSSVSGWGNTQAAGEGREQLRVAIVPVVGQSDCEAAYQGFTISPRMICAGYKEGGKDSCQGDSGGPLVYNGVLNGVVSWGLGCAQANYPGVYARVASAREWIKQNSGV